MINIDKIKDNLKNLETRSETYVDSESFRHNFEGSEKELKTVAKTVYDCVDGTVSDEDFINGCKSMLQYDYDYLKSHQEDKVLLLIEELICNNGNFKGDE